MKINTNNMKNTKQPQPKILTLDIETIGIQVDSLWTLWENNVSISEISQDQAIISCAAKWLGDKQVMYKDTSNKKNCRDDKELIKWILDLILQADILVGHNLKHFDIPKIKARALFHKLPPVPPFIIADTKDMARNVGKFTSTKLEYLSANFTNSPKSKHKKFPGKELWLAILRGEQAAWKECKAYNIQDVKSTEEWFLTLRPWATNVPNMAMYYDDTIQRCPRCGGTHINRAGVHTTNTSQFPRYKCDDCGGYSRSRRSLTTTDKRKAGTST